MSDERTVHASCKNGGCQRPIYRGRVCFRCWAGIKWTSVMQRVANKNGNNNSYEGIQPWLYEGRIYPVGS
jgi:hypothetical protein